MAGRPIRPTLAAYPGGIVQTHRRHQYVFPQVKRCAARVDHLHAGTAPSWYRRGILENVKTGKRARGQTISLAVRCRGYPPQGFSQAFRFVAAPLAGAQGIPGHTRSRAQRAPLFSRPQCRYQANSDAVSSLQVARLRAGDYSFQNELLQALPEVAPSLMLRRIGIEDLLSPREMKT